MDFYLADQAGNPIGDLLDLDWNLETQLEVESDGQTTPLTLAIKTRGHWIGDAVFEKNGDYVLLASAWARNRAGDEVVLLDKEIVMPFTVRPMMLVRVNIVHPEPQSQHAWRDIFWRRRRLEIEVAIQDKSEAPLTPEQFLQEPVGAPITVEMVSPHGESSGPLTLARSHAPGCYLATYERYEPFLWYAHRDLGWYDVRVQPGGALQGTYVYEKPAGVTARVHLKRHTLWWLLPVSLGIVFAALLAVAVRRAYLHLWSAEGTLSVETEGIAFPWRRQLRDSGRHTLTFSQRDGLPPVFRRIVVRQRRGSGHQPIEATVQLKKGVKMPLRLVDGARKPLGEGIFVAYERGAGVAASSQASLSPAVWVNGLWALLMLAGLGGVVFSFVASLS